MTAMLAVIVATFRQPAAIMKRRSRRILLIRRRIARCFVCDAAAQEPCKLTAIGTGDRRRRARRPHACCSPTAASCGSPASKPPTTAAPLAGAAGHPLRLERLGAGAGPLRPPGRLCLCRRRGPIRAADLAGARPGAGVGAGRRQGLRRRAFSAPNSAARAARRGLWADPNFAPLSAENLARAKGRARPVRAGGRQGLVGARKRGHYICEFRAPLDAGLHRDHSAALCGGPSPRPASSRNARRPPHPGARMDRAARRPDHRGRGARADRDCSN